MDKNDLAIARLHVCNEALGLPAPRADFLGYAIICLLQQSKTLTEAQICEAFNITDEKRKNRVGKTLNSFVNKKILSFERK